MYQSLDPRKFSVSIRSDGMDLYTLCHAGKSYVVVEDEDLGRPYQIRVQNHRNISAEVVVSVDGLSVMNGQPASSNDAGYVLYAHEHYDIKGWRRGLNEVAAFTFESLKDSYAGKTDRPENVGVIGVLFYEEKPRPVVRRHHTMKGTKKLGAFDLEGHSLNASNSIGTGYGSKLQDNVQTVKFERSLNAPIMYKFYYKTRPQLEAMGIRLPVNRRLLSNDPNPFPADSKYFTPEP